MQNIQKGDGILKSFDTEYGRIAPFICSDMAFLSKIQQAGRDNVDILIVPASDWKEMTLLAAKTAIVRGVENGSNIELLGHSDVSTTMNVYAHATREAKRDSAKLLDKVVGMN